ncbi:unnamed protein product [Gongylonema pulchrum]|uniref:Brix domain-containing protein n=1 Tax=Gongylonema pulchrum TaxID=637853 RepID=A0A183F0X7_9BILA|nr:unnamed protein product [Gongylonema pulchrum]
MSAYFVDEIPPKVLITTSPAAKVNTFKFCYELQKCIPNAGVYTRKGVPLKKVVKQAKASGYTDLIVVHEDRKIPSNFLFLDYFTFVCSHNMECISLWLTVAEIEQHSLFQNLRPGLPVTGVIVDHFCHIFCFFNVKNTRR